MLQAHFTTTTSSTTTTTSPPLYNTSQTPSIYHQVARQVDLVTCLPTAIHTLWSTSYTYTDPTSTLTDILNTYHTGRIPYSPTIREYIHSLPTPSDHSPLRGKAPTDLNTPNPINKNFELLKRTSHNIDKSMFTRASYTHKDLHKLISLAFDHMNLSSSLESIITPFLPEGHNYDPSHGGGQNYDPSRGGGQNYDRSYIGIPIYDSKIKTAAINQARIIFSDHHIRDTCDIKWTKEVFGQALSTIQLYTNHILHTIPTTHTTNNTSTTDPSSSTTQQHDELPIPVPASLLSLDLSHYEYILEVVALVKLMYISFINLRYDVKLLMHSHDVYITPTNNSTATTNTTSTHANSTEGSPDPTMYYNTTTTAANTDLKLHSNKPHISLLNIRPLLDLIIAFQRTSSSHPLGRVGSDKMVSKVVAEINHILFQTLFLFASEPTSHEPTTTTTNTNNTNTNNKNYTYSSNIVSKYNTHIPTHILKHDNLTNTISYTIPAYLIHSHCYYIPLPETRISASDRSFLTTLSGDGICSVTVIPTYINTVYTCTTSGGSKGQNYDHKEVDWTCIDIMYHAFRSAEAGSHSVIRSEL